ncbi:hypothetical protein P8936_06325 [Edaphobacter paludis]|uniref:Apea-like HEPN domain-containing protein n=1 Tax=Edaphobacter paludis TaxID=3035702 RepID=A0AAU7DBT3_9BACT
MNPILYDVLDEDNRYQIAKMTYTQGRAFISSRVLYLCKDSQEGEKMDTDWPSEELDELMRLLPRLRYTTGQSDLPRGEDISVAGSDWKFILPEMKPLEPIYRATILRPSQLVDAVTLTTFQQAVDLPPEFVAPMQATLYLDAVTAYRRGEPRICILFSAMAMEIGFGTALDQAHESALNDPNNPRYRVVNIPIGNGEFSTKDPIFDRLKERVDFSTRMHEMALYAFGRSLRLEDEVLYKRALTLYRSRNKIVHLGTTEDAKEVLSVDSSGALAALQTAHDSLKWLGMNVASPTSTQRWLLKDEYKAFAESLPI